MKTQFEIFRKSEELFIVFEGKQILKVKRDHNWLARFVSAFYENGQLIMKSYQVTWFFRKKMALTFQDPKLEFALVKEEGKYYIKYNGDMLYVKVRPFRDKAYVIYRNGIEVGNGTYLSRKDESMPAMRVDFEDHDPGNYYSLLLMIMHLSTFVAT